MIVRFVQKLLLSLERMLFTKSLAVIVELKAQQNFLKDQQKNGGTKVLKRSLNMKPKNFPARKERRKIIAENKDVNFDTSPPMRHVLKRTKCPVNDKTSLMKGDSRKPRFCEWIRGIWASETNPCRDGMYVETIKQTGRLNPGIWYRLTDGKGKFWQYEAKDTLYLNGELIDKECPDCGSPLEDNGACSDVGNNNCRYQA